MKNQAKEVVYNLEASEFNWDIAPGKTIEAWGFNKQLPGPELRANVGDTLVVRLTNRLKEPTMIHWHGLRIPAAMDGTGVAPTDFQQPPGPGAVGVPQDQFQPAPGQFQPDSGSQFVPPTANSTVPAGSKIER